MSVTNKSTFPQLGDEEISGEVERISLKKRKKSKGFEGEVKEGSVNVEASMCMMPLKDIPGPSFSFSSGFPHKTRILDPVFTMDRAFETIPNEDGGAETNVKVECTLEEIAAATNLRIDDAAFALNECGLLMRRLLSGEDEGQKQVVVVTRRLVEKVAKERNIKRMYMDLNCVMP
jgi:histone acetyltransferase HTATIP/histone acetyltransferase MYST1